MHITHKWSNGFVVVKISWAAKLPCPINSYQSDDIVGLVVIIVINLPVSLSNDSILILSWVDNQAYQIFLMSTMKG